MTDNKLSSFLFGDVLPQAMFKRVTLEGAGPAEDKAELKLMLRNVIESGEAVSFFGEDDIYKNFVAFVYTSYDKRATDFLLENYNSLTKMEVQEEENYNFEFKKVSNLFDPATSSEQFDNNGNKVISTALNVANFLPSENRHLTYFVVLGVDIDSPTFLQQFGVDGSFDFEGIETSIYNKPVIFKAIENNQIVSSRLFFVTGDEDLWLEDVSVSVDNGNLIYEGIPDDDEEIVPLKLKMSSENIVQDFRDPERFEQPLQINKVPTDLTFLREEIKLLNNDKKDVQRKETYISDIYLSRDLLGQGKLVFSVDYFNLIRDKSLFGNLVNDTTFADVARKTRISSLKVIRRRVKKEKGKNKLNSPFAASTVLFDEEEIEEVVVMSADDEGSSFFIPQDDSSNKISEIILNFSNDIRIRTFNVLDSDLRLKTFGMYQYGVEIQIEDNISLLFDQILLNLESSRQTMQQYYEDSLSYSWEDGVREKHFDTKTDTFTTQFKKFVDEKYPGLSFVENAHNQILKFYNFLGSSDYDENTIKSFNSMVDPVDGSPKGILTFVNFVDSNISLLRRILKQNLSKTKPKSNLNYSSSNKTASEKGGGQRTIDFRTLFITDFANVEDAKFVGIDYLNGDEALSTGLSTFSKSSFNDVVTDISNIYYSEGTLAVQVGRNTYGLEAAQYSFLSPQVFHFGQNRLFTTSNLYQPESEIILENIINYSIGKDSETYLVTTNLENSTKTNTEANEESLLRQIYSYFNVTFPMLENTDGNPVELVNTSISGRVSKFGFNYQPIDPLPTDIEEPEFHQNPLPILKNLLQIFLQNNSFSRSEGVFNLFSKNKNYNKISLIPSAPSISPQDANIGNFSIATNPAPAPDEYDMNTEEIYNPLSSEDNAVLNLMKNLAYFDRVEKLTTNSVTDKVRSITDDQIDSLFLSLPNQVKSLFAWKNGSNSIAILGRVPTRITDIIREKNSIFVILFTMLKKVEYLAGYETLESGNRIKNEKWEVLDLAAFDNLSNNKYLLCRLVDYNPEELGLSKNDILDMPTLNKHFLITGE